MPPSTRMPSGGPNAVGGGVGGRVGAGVGATVKLQVTSWSASATAVPAASAEGKTTSGQEKVGRPAHASMSRRNAVSIAASSVLKVPALAPSPTGRTASGDLPANAGVTLATTSSLSRAVPGGSFCPSVKKITADRVVVFGSRLAASSRAAT